MINFLYFLSGMCSGVIVGILIFALLSINNLGGKDEKFTKEAK